MLQHKAHHIFRANSTKETICSLLHSPNRETCTKSLSNKWDCLAQGNKYGVSSTNNINFIHRHEVPTDRQVTYSTYACDHNPLKDEELCVWIPVGGDRLTYLDDAGSPAANLLKIKVLLNSIVSDAKRGHVSWQKIHNTTSWPPQWHDQSSYKLSSEDYTYIRINKEMYDLKQAAILVYEILKQSLAPHGYSSIIGTVGIWGHKTRANFFAFVLTILGSSILVKLMLNICRTPLDRHKNT